MAAVAVVGGFVGRPQNRLVRPFFGQLVGLRVRALAVLADAPDQRDQHGRDGQRHAPEEGMSQCGAHDANRITAGG